jgi:hypothetical protein
MKPVESVAFVVENRSGFRRQRNQINNTEQSSGSIKASEVTATIPGLGSAEIRKNASITVHFSFL